jgi:hypothetical protein
VNSYKNNIYAYRFISERLKDDKLLAMASVARDGMCIKYVSERLKDDRELALSAVKMNGLCIQYVSGRLRDDREIILTAVSENGNAIHCLPKHWKTDGGIVGAALKQNPAAIQHVPKFLRKSLVKIEYYTGHNDITLTLIADQAAISGRAINICKDNQLNSLYEIIRYYLLFTNFLRLENCDKRSNNQLIGFCIQYLRQIPDNV